MNLSMESPAAGAKKNPREFSSKIWSYQPSRVYSSHRIHLTMSSRITGKWLRRNGFIEIILISH